VTFTLVHAGK